MRIALKTFGGAVAGAFFALVAARGIEALAETSPNTAQDDVTRVVPYHGRIERHGAPFSGDVDMRFTLWSAATGGAARWSEEHSPSAGAGRQRVTAYAGEFTAELGAYDLGGTTDLVDIVADAEPLWLSVEVRLPGASSYTALSGRQQLTAAPYAVWSGQGSALNVSGDVTVNGTLTVGSLSIASQITLPASDARIALGLSATGTAYAGKHGLTFIDAGTGVDDGGSLVYDTSANQLQFVKKDGTTTNFVVDVDDKSFTTRGKLSLASASTATTTVAGKVTVASGYHVRTDTHGSVNLSGSQEGAYFGVAFGDTDGGLQMIYDTSNNNLVFETGDGITNGSDLLTFSRDSSRMTVHAGNARIGGKIIRSRVSRSGGSEVDATVDKVYAADASCTTGAIRIGKNNDWASICVCLDAERDQGWYCFD